MLDVRTWQMLHWKETPKNFYQVYGEFSGDSGKPRPECLKTPWPVGIYGHIIYLLDPSPQVTKKVTHTSPLSSKKKGHSKKLGRKSLFKYSELWITTMIELYKIQKKYSQAKGLVITFSCCTSVPMTLFFFMWGLEAVLEELQHGSGAALLRFPATFIEDLGEDACERCFLGLCTLVIHFFVWNFLECVGCCRGEI